MVMKQQKWLPVLLGALVLWGCNNSEDTSQVELLVGVYQGVVWSDAQVPMAAQLVLQADASVLLTLWDEREHQSSYLTHSEESQVQFAALNLDCELSAEAAECSNANGNTRLALSSAEAVSLSEYAGRYQTRYNDALYQMVIEADGLISISGESCSSSGELSAVAAAANLAQLRLADSQCFAVGELNLASLHLDNQALLSLNVLSSELEVPQVWLAL